MIIGLMIFSYHVYNYGPVFNYDRKTWKELYNVGNDFGDIPASGSPWSGVSTGLDVWTKEQNASNAWTNSPIVIPDWTEEHPTQDGEVERYPDGS